MRDVFNPNEFGGENNGNQVKSKQPKLLNEKQAKVEFVQKLIDFVARNKQPVVGCVAAKIVACVEPNKSNELLQALGKVALAKQAQTSSGGGRQRTFTRQTGAAAAAQTADNPATGSVRKSSSASLSAQTPKRQEKSILVPAVSKSPPTATAPADEPPKRGASATRQSFASNTLAAHKPLPSPAAQTTNIPRNHSDELSVNKVVNSQQLRSSLKHLRLCLDKLVQVEQSVCPKLAASGRPPTASPQLIA